jgi:hypothetical protein
MEPVANDCINICHSDNSPGAASKTLAKVTARQTWLEEAKGNAALMVAAPDLYAALKMLMEDAIPAYQTGYIPAATWMDARLAIQKATEP